MFDFLNLVSDRNSTQTGVEFLVKHSRTTSVYCLPEEQVVKEPFKLKRKFKYGSVQDQVETNVRLEARYSEEEDDFKSSLTPLHFTTSRDLWPFYKPFVVYGNGTEILRTLNFSRGFNPFLMAQLQPEARLSNEPKIVLK